MRTFNGPEPRVKIEILSGRALTGSGEIVLSDAHWLFVCALARCHHPTPPDQMRAILWPDCSEDRANNQFGVTLHRLRKLLGAGFVVQSPEGYRLGDHVVVDLWEIESLAAESRSDVGKDQALIQELWLQIYRRIACGCGRSSGGRDFVQALERRFLGAARITNERVAESALQRGDAVVALELARLTLRAEPCDEAARLIAIRCHLALRNRAAAIREYCEYVQVLAEELELEPCFKIRSLIEPEPLRAAAAAS